MRFRSASPRTAFANSGGRFLKVIAFIARQFYASMTHQNDAMSILSLRLFSVLRSCQGAILKSPQILWHCPRRSRARVGRRWRRKETEYPAGRGGPSFPTVALRSPRYGRALEDVYRSKGLLRTTGFQPRRRLPEEDEKPVAAS